MLTHTKIYQVINNFRLIIILHAFIYVIRSMLELFVLKYGQWIFGPYLKYDIVEKHLTNVTTPGGILERFSCIPIIRI